MFKQFFDWLGFHAVHQYGVPHRNDKQQLILTCYACGHDKIVRVL